MSEENVRIVQALVAAHQRGDFAAVFAAYDPEIEWRIDRLPEYFGDFEPVYRGHDGVKSFWRVWFSAWEDATFEYEQFIDAGDSVVSILTQRMRGRTSGLMAEWRSYAQVWALRDGKVIRVEFFATRDAALEAVGVRD
jgi:ketosteroid isomerase-like protein